MSIYVLSHSVKKDDVVLINKMIEAATDKAPTSIDDLECIEPNYSDGMTIITLGKRAERYLAAQNLSGIALPHQSKLSNKPQNQKHRKQAWEILRSMNKIQSLIPEQKNTICVDSIPSWVTSQADKLEQVFAQKGIDSWKCKDKSGKEILVSLQPKKTDCLNLTVSELLILKTLHDLFEIETIEQQ